MYLHTIQSSARLHHKNENIQTIHEDACPNPKTDRHVDTFSSFDITNDLSRNMVKEYIVVTYHVYKYKKRKIKPQKPYPHDI